MFGLGFSEIIVVCIIALIFIGPKQLPEVAKAIAKFLNELKRASEEVSRSVYSSTKYDGPQNETARISEIQNSEIPETQNLDINKKDSSQNE